MCDAVLQCGVTHWTLMIFLPADPHHPPHGRVDGVIYYGALAVATPVVPLGLDTDTGEIVYWHAATSAWATVSILDGQLSANVPIMTAGVLPAVDGSLLTGIVRVRFTAASSDPGGSDGDFWYQTTGSQGLYVRVDGHWQRLLGAVSGANSYHQPTTNYVDHAQVGVGVTQSLAAAIAAGRNVVDGLIVDES